MEVRSLLCQECMLFNTCQTKNKIAEIENNYSPEDSFNAHMQIAAAVVTAEKRKCPNVGIIYKKMIRRIHPRILSEEYPMFFLRLL